MKKIAHVVGLIILSVTAVNAEDYSRPGLMPASYEMNFWPGVLYVESGRTDEALEYFALAFEERPILIELIPRLAVSGSLPEDEAILERILAVGSKISKHK